MSVFEVAPSLTFTVTLARPLSPGVYESFSCEPVTAAVTRFAGVAPTGVTDATVNVSPGVGFGVFGITLASTTSIFRVPCSGVSPTLGRLAIVFASARPAASTLPKTVKPPFW